jgi:phosphoglycolate phosphatase
MYKYIFLDLDGTITDSEEGIINSIVYALESVGAAKPEYSVLRKFIGPSLSYSYKTFLGFDDIKTREAVKKYRERFESVGLYENKLYEGIKEMLEALKLKGKILVLATAKPRPYAVKILDYFKISENFDYISAVEFEGGPLEKKDVITNALNAINITDKTSVAMVGDRKYDILGAKETGITAIGAGYGFAEDGELADAGADYVFDTVNELKNFLITN